MHFMAQAGPSSLMQHRRTNIEWYEKRKLELGVMENKLHSNLPADIEKVVADKNILLFKEMLDDIEYDDMSVVYLRTLGTKFVGLLPRSGIWKPQDQSPKCSPGPVLAGAEFAKSKLRTKKICKKEDWQIIEAVWKATEEEIQLGVLKGPFTEKEADAEMGSRAWVPARKFGITQGTRSAQSMNTQSTAIIPQLAQKRKYR